MHAHTHIYVCNKRGRETNAFSRHRRRTLFLINTYIYVYVHVIHECLAACTRATPLSPRTDVMQMPRAPHCDRPRSRRAYYYYCFTAFFYVRVVIIAACLALSPRRARDLTTAIYAAAGLRKSAAAARGRGKRFNPTPCTLGPRRRCAVGRFFVSTRTRHNVNGEWGEIAGNPSYLSQRYVPFCSKTTRRTMTRFSEFRNARLAGGVYNMSCAFRR